MSILFREQETVVCLAVLLIVPQCCCSLFKQDTPAVNTYRYEIDLNTAEAGEWQTLPGIGPKLADAIVQHRTEKPFAAKEDIRRVKGIGIKKYEAIQPFLREIKSPAATP
ncbi:MAG: helix-hairpin-helix domain-containing protein [Planctomycetaceae bacterium]|nr:helix-hairpin-helix domain-containing protein [Planctomycetaceae bacterium]